MTTTANTIEAVQQSIIANPEDTNLRLKLADQFEQARDIYAAELIRTQVSLATPELRLRERLLLQRKESFLLSDQSKLARLLGPAAIAAEVHFDRGLPGYVELSDFQFNQYGVEIFNLLPIGMVKLWLTSQEEMIKLRENPAFLKIKKLIIEGGTISPFQLFADKTFPVLRWLSLTYTGNENQPHFGNTFRQVFPALKYLRLNKLPYDAPTSGFVTTLLSNPPYQQLTGLCLYGNVKNVELETLGCVFSDTIKYLEIGYTKAISSSAGYVNCGRNHINSIKYVGWPLYKACMANVLAHPDLNALYISDLLQADFSLAISRIQTLGLQGEYLNDAHITTLCRSSHTKKLQTLILGGQFTDRAIDTLVGASNFPILEILKIGSDAFTNTAQLEARFAKAPHMPKLRKVIVVPKRRFVENDYPARPTGVWYQQILRPIGF
jgi:uncharacterized protein (TIGR02996 family)